MSTQKDIERSIESQIKKALVPNKVVVLVGARRIGKTSLVKKMVSSLPNEKILQQLWFTPTLEGYFYSFNSYLTSI